MTETSQEHREQNTHASEQENEIQDLQQEIATLKTELQEKNDKYLMVLAESENARKRMQKERQEFAQYAVENTIIDFLIPIESMEKALEFASKQSDEVKNWAIGFNMILQQFKQILEEKGVVEYSSAGQQFNPYLHDAVETQETNEFPAGTILEEFSKGYKMGEKPIRVSKVKVARSAATQTENDNNQQ